MRRGNGKLELENTLFQSYLERAAARNPAAFATDDKSRAAAVQRKQGAMKKVGLEQYHKYEVAVQEMDDIREETEELRASHEKLVDSLRASMEETDIRISEIKKDAYEFKRDIIIGAEDPRSGKIAGEKMIRWAGRAWRQRGTGSG